MFLSENDQQLNRLFDELVPLSGKAATLAGEIVRATARLGYRYFNDGDHIGVGYGKETCNAPARFLINKTNEEIAGQIKKMWGLTSEHEYSELLDVLTGFVVKYINDHPELRKAEVEDMFDYSDPEEDRDDDEDDEL